VQFRQESILKIWLTKTGKSAGVKMEVIRGSCHVIYKIIGGNLIEDFIVNSKELRSQDGKKFFLIYLCHPIKVGEERIKLKLRRTY
jgi:hypothetical protein